MVRTFIIAILLLSSVFSASAQEPTLNVLASTTIIADIAQNVGGDLVQVQPLIPADTDSHAFELRPADIVMIEEADLLLLNGGGLEGFLEALLENTTTELLTVASGVEVLAFSHSEEEHVGEHEHHDEAEVIGVLGQDVDCDVHAHGDHEAEHADEADHGEEAHDHGECDPHFWGNPQHVVIYAQNIAAAFARLDPENAAVYEANAEAYAEQISALDAELEAIFSVIPEENRVIVTNHEFLGYFAARYGFEIVGTVIPGVSTLAETNPRELADLQAVIQEEGVRAIFAEVSQTSTLAQVLADEIGSDIQVVYLYSEALSAEDGPAASYIEYMRFNAAAIAGALGTE